MKAIYYCEDSSPYTIMVIDVPAKLNLSTTEEFIWELIDNDYPFPSSEVVFISNDLEIERMSLTKEDRNKYDWYPTQVRKCWNLSS